MNPTVIISRQPDSAPEAAQLERELADVCAEHGLDAILTPDLYSLPADSALWRSLQALDAPLVVLAWLHPRPAGSLLHSHGLGAAGLHAFDLAQFADTQAAFAALQSALELPARNAPGTLHEHDEPTSPRWYPVRDAGRCTNCRHCLQFCLFSVYELDAAGNVVVANPDNCKAGCPACSRVCPSSAIMFPRYAQDPAISGAPGQFVVLDAEGARMFRDRLTALPASRKAELQGEVDSLLGEIDALIDRLDAKTSEAQE